MSSSAGTGARGELPPQLRGTKLAGSEPAPTRFLPAPTNSYQSEKQQQYPRDRSLPKAIPKAFQPLSSARYATRALWRKKFWDMVYRALRLPLHSLVLLLLPLFLAVASSSWSDSSFPDALLLLVGKVPRIPRFFLIIFFPLGHFPDLVQINKTTFLHSSHFFTLPQPICPTIHKSA